MRWVLRLMTTGDDAGFLSTDLIEICRSEGLGDIANPGLTGGNTPQSQRSGGRRPSREAGSIMGGLRTSRPEF